MYNEEYLLDIRQNRNKIYIPKGFKFIGKPYYHQLVTFIYGIYRKNLAILSNVGTGKTKAVIDIARYWLQIGEARKVLVICPTSVLGNWKLEIEKFSEYDATILHSGSSSREKRLKLFKLDSTFYIINYEALTFYLKSILRNIDFDIIIFDESSRIANPRAKQTRVSCLLSTKAKFHYILNGTPIANKPLDLWSQYYAIDFGETLGDSFYKYRKKYFAAYKVKSGNSFFHVLKIKSQRCLEEIAEAISSSSIRYRKEECGLDLPAKVYQKREIVLPSANRKLYEEVMENTLLELRKLEKRISTKMLITKFVKTIQLTSGYVRTDEGSIIRFENNPKLEELKRIIQEIIPEHACIVWCKYLYTIEIIKEMLKKMGISPLIITGEEKDKTKIAEVFQKSSILEFPVMICQIRSGGVGINLHKASYNIFFENEWRLQDRYQAEGRTHRIGQENKVTYIDLIVKDSIDELVLSAIKTNKEIADYILQRVL